MSRKGSRKATARHNQWLACVAASALSITMVTAPAPAMAQSSSIRFEIPAQPLADALLQISRQGHVDVMAPEALTRGRMAPAVFGTMSPREALSRVLAGAGLRLRRAGGGGYIVEVETRRGNAPALSEGAASSGGTQVAGAAVDSESVDSVIVVTGSNIRNRTQLTAPLLTLTNREMVRSGAPGLERAFEALPQNFDNISQDGRFANEGGSRLGQANNEQAYAVDLRGIGAQSTLTLVNGRRRAGSVNGTVVDISLIPLSAVERVEILTGGRSAIYGSDAIAGVVNIVTRTSFQGAQTDLYFGDSSYPGGQQIRLTQTAGLEREDWGLIASYDFARDYRLDLANTDLIAPPRPGATTQIHLDAQAPATRHSVYLGGHWKPTDNLTLSLTSNYADRHSNAIDRRRNSGAAFDTVNDNDVSNQLFAITGSADLRVGTDWRIALSADYSQTDVFLDEHDSLSSGAQSTFNKRDQSNTSAITAVADGPLFHIGSIVPRLAVGIESRRENFDTLVSTNAVVSKDFEGSRSIQSAFAELLIPLFETGSRHLVELSAAARYDNYSDVGGTFNPQFGLTFTPVTGFRLYGGYSTAFRAPSLSDQSSSLAFVESGPDPLIGGALSPILSIGGVADNLQPERARTWNAGFVVEAPALSWLRLTGQYFRIAYRDRLEQPAVNADRRLALVNSARFPGILNRAPTQADVNAATAPRYFGDFSGLRSPPCPTAAQLLTCYPNLAIFDNRLTNVAVENVDGVDFSATAQIPMLAGTATIGINGTYTFQHIRRLTPTSPAASLVNSVGKPSAFRFQARVGWDRPGYGLTALVNYVDGYANPFSTPASTLSSWTTVDLSAHVTSTSATHGLLSGIDVNLSVNNLFNTRPPLFLGGFSGVIYDTTNANPRGRFVSLRVSKRW